MEKMEIAVVDLARKALVGMVHKRQELNHHGGIAVMFGQKTLVDELRSGKITDVLFQPVFEVDQIMRSSSKDPNVFHNFPMTAAGKLWQMVRTGRPSGPEDVISGEPEWEGGVITEWGDFYVFFSFSGGPPEEDVKIAQAGIATLPDYHAWVAALG
ncbi:MAG: hypothetical protein WAX66_00385 [Patescibacteria group bacterium]